MEKKCGAMTKAMSSPIRSVLKTASMRQVPLQSTKTRVLFSRRFFHRGPGNALRANFRRSFRRSFPAARYLECGRGFVCTDDLLCESEIPDRGGLTGRRGHRLYRHLGYAG